MSVARGVFGSCCTKRNIPCGLAFAHGVSRSKVAAPSASYTASASNSLERVAQLSLLNVDISNHLYRGDCLSVLDRIPDNSIDFVYIDPPFYSQRYYETFWGEDAERYAFADRWRGGIQTYLNYLVERIRKLHYKLKPSGGICLHLDWHVCHYVKVELDKIFGYQNFQNEIIWHYTNKLGTGGKVLDRQHDTLLWYTKDKNTDYPFNFLKEPVKLPKPQPVTRKVGGKRMWLRDAAGRRLYKKSVMKRIGDVWDLPIINPMSKERIGYPTQKPLALLERIISFFTNKGDLVLDAFCGCGTTLEAAQRLGRRWIGIDISQTAIRVVENRIRKVGAAPTQVHGMVESEDDLRAMDWREFQNWAVDAIQGRHSPRKIADMGIDGFTFMENHPIQVKQIDGVGRPVIDNFVGVLDRQKDKRGIIIALEFTRGAQAEVARLKREADIEIELISCKRLLREEIPYRQLA